MFFSDKIGKIYISGTIKTGMYMYVHVRLYTRVHVRLYTKLQYLIVHRIR